MSSPNGISPVVGSF